MKKRGKKTMREWESLEGVTVETGGEHNRRGSERVRGTVGKSRREEIKPRAPAARAANGGWRPCTNPTAGSRGYKQH